MQPGREAPGIFFAFQEILLLCSSLSSYRLTQLPQQKWFQLSNKYSRFRQKGPTFWNFQKTVFCIINVYYAQTENEFEK